MGTPAEELVEVVDEHGTTERIVTRAEMRRDRLRHRATFIAVVDPVGRLLVHRRSDRKDLWPSRWDLAAGGVSAVDEPWEVGARRELMEELGIDAEVEALGTDRFEDDDVKVVGAVFVARHEGPYRFVDGEVAEARWVDLAELDELLADHPVCPDSVALVLPRVRHLLR